MAVGLLWVCVSEPLNVSPDIRLLAHVAGGCTGWYRVYIPYTTFAVVLHPGCYRYILSSSLHMPPVTLCHDGTTMTALPGVRNLFPGMALFKFVFSHANCYDLLELHGLSIEEWRGRNVSSLMVCCARGYIRICDSHRLAQIASSRSSGALPYGRVYSSQSPPLLPPIASGSHQSTPPLRDTAHPRYPESGRQRPSTSLPLIDTQQPTSRWPIPRPSSSNNSTIISSRYPNDFDTVYTTAGPSRSQDESITAERVPSIILPPSEGTRTACSSLLSSPTSPNASDDGGSEPETGKRGKHKCPTCGTRWARPSSLKIHQVTHTGEKCEFFF